MRLVENVPPRTIADLPRPKGLPVVGNVLQLSQSQLHLILERWAQELGAPFCFYVGSTPITVWTDVDLIQGIMRERPHRYRRYQPIESVLREIGCNGVFSSEGADWEPQRRLVTQALSIPNIRTLYPTLADITDRLRKRWTDAALRGAVVEMTEDLKRYTVDVTSALAFGEDPRTLEREHGVIQERLERIPKLVRARINALFPYWRYISLPRDREAAHDIAEVHRYVSQLIDRARTRMKDDPSDVPRNLLEAMLAMRDQPGSGFTDEHVSANVLTLLLAGEDTVASSMAWAMSYICADFNLLKQLGIEARRALGGSPVCPDYATLKQLDVFEAVCTEATRLRPVAPIQSFEPLEDVRVGNVELPAGTRMLFLARAAMADSRNFSNPDQYDPYRWLEKGKREAHDTRAYLQFGAGPRVCPGRHLAAVQMRLVLSMLTANFDVELALDPADVEEIQAVTMMPAKMPVKLGLRPDTPDEIRQATC